MFLRLGRSIIGIFTVLTLWTMPTYAENQPETFYAELPDPNALDPATAPPIRLSITTVTGPNAKDAALAKIKADSEIFANQHIKPEVVVSSSEPETLAQLTDEAAKSNLPKKISVLSVLTRIEDFKNDYVQRVKGDPLTFMYATAQWGTGAWVWYSSGQFSQSARFANIFYSALLTYTIGINHTLWDEKITATTRHLGDFLQRMGWVKNNPMESDISRILLKAGPNILASATLASVTRTIVSWDTLYQDIHKPGFIGDVFMMGAAGTVSGIFWGEILSQAKESGGKSSNEALIRFHQFRGLLLAFYASSAVILSHDPVALRAILISSSLGLAVWMDRDRFIEMLDNDLTVNYIVTSATLKSQEIQSKFAEMREKFRPLYEKIAVKTANICALILSTGAF